MDDISSGLNHLNAAFLDSLYADYRCDPESVPPHWREFFRDCDGDGRAQLRSPDGVTLDLPGGGQASTPMRHPQDPAIEQPGAVTPAAVLQDRVDQLVRAYRVRGHMVAQIDPLGLPRPGQPELDPAHYGLSELDMDRPVSSRTIAGPAVRTLRELLQRLRNTYCRSIGVQFMHVDELPARHWLQERMEASENRLSLNRREQFRILSRLTEAATFEEFLQRKYVGAKTFSLEGCESLIPLLDLAIERAGEHGVREIVLGMTHRGRLNVLANILGKRPADIFREFEDDEPSLDGAGDVKYHLGYSTDWDTAAGRPVHLSLCFNPSHLEFIDCVAMGRMRAKQDRAGDLRRERGMVLLIHGDAAFAGEGMVQEMLNLSQLPGYTVGGSVHIIANNQIGFTTPPAEARSTSYATAVAKMLDSPIFHVNGEDPEAVAQVLHVALDFRMEFKRDVVIDMYGYRRRGHNEMDEPSFTQPVMYHAVRERPSVRHSYVDHLVQLGKITHEQAEAIAAAAHQALEEALASARATESTLSETAPAGLWAGYRGGPEDPTEEVRTAVDQPGLAALLRQMLEVPQGFQRHPRLNRFVAARQEMAEGRRSLDWSAAEALALASLASAGVRVRLCGQDTARGTFSQRHAVLYDHEDGTPYVPLQNLSPHQAPVEVLNSPLSEAGALGFEYGYSLDCPDGLVMWEAQYGDFVNAAQVIVDQFIVSAEHKWRRLSGLVLLLPHGYEGQGPEHSSARIERFLQLAAGDNIQIAQPSTPAQYFHLLRRQVLRAWRKPLVVFTPKSLLRHPAAVSDLEDLAAGGFQRIIADSAGDPAGIRRILLCAGKIYYELAAARENEKRTDVALVRLEQYYPLSLKTLESVLAPYGNETQVCWVQEEPQNMGAWLYLWARLGPRLLGRFPLTGVYRPESPSPAAGSHAAHQRDQENLIRSALGE